MRIVFMAILVLAISGVGFSQNPTIEKDFERNKLKYDLERFAEGEDASSGYYYLIYKNKNKIVKIREIWSSSANPNFRVEDYFFKDGKLALLAKYALAKRNYKAAIKGVNIPLKEIEKFYITKSKLTVWIENGKKVAESDGRWLEKEKEILEAGKSQIENYQSLKEEM